MRTSWFVILLVAPTLCLRAQGFQLTHGQPDHREGVAMAVHGSTLVTVVQQASRAADMGVQLLLTDLQGGSPEWVDIGMSGRVFIQQAVAHGDDLLLCGSLIRPGRNDHDALLMRVTMGGAVVWQWATNTAQVEEQLLGTAVLDPDGVLAGGVRRGAADSDAYMVRLDADGGLLWEVHHGTAADEKLQGVASLADGFVGAGRVMNAGGESDAYVLRVDANGAELDWQSWGDIAHDEFMAITAQPSQVVLAGYSVDPASPVNARRKRAYMLALDADGDTLWTRTIGDTQWGFEARAIAQAPDGGFFVGGAAVKDHRSDALLLRLTAEGGLVWQRSYHLERNDVLADVQPLADGGVVATGRSFGHTGGRVLLLRKDANGD